MYQKEIYSVDEKVRVSPGLKQPPYSKQPLYQEEQPYRDYDQQPYRYDDAYVEPKHRNIDSHLQYDSRVPPYEEQWPAYDHQGAPPQRYDPSLNYQDGSDRDYSPPQSRYDTGYDTGRPRYGKPGPGPAHYDEPPPPAVGSYDGRSRYDHGPNNLPPAVSRSPEPPKQQYYEPPPARPPHSQPSQRGYMNSDEPPPPPKLEPLPSPPETAAAASKPLPPPPAETEEDPAMKPQSVLTRVKMFENKRSVSVDRARESADSTVRVSIMVS